MSELSKAYEPKDVEKKWYKTWQDQGLFKGKIDAAKKPFAIMIPPPNVTGILTLGHVLNNTLQDVLIRRARMQGQSALWLPGTDHAGIATQTKVEQALKKEGTSRLKLGREKFIERAKNWRDEHGGLIIEQLKRLGASCDWDRMVHTLDDNYSQGVISAFVNLYKKGHIYRGKRMINWCPESNTALSDEEVVMKPVKRKLYKIKYEVVEMPDESIEICTTRPETIMGDTAIAVHPEDERYKHLIGKHCYRPLEKAEIPIIADTAVDKDFGTGALKITPAHDKVDFEIGQRHNLAIRNILNPDGTLNEVAGKFAGMTREEGRKATIKKLKEMDQLIDIEDHESNVGFSERANVIIEPRISEQWFLKYPRVEEAKMVVRQKIVKFYPERWVKTYLHWLDTIQDWCISRQLWWGHRIPVWYKKGADKKDSKNWHVGTEGPEDPENWEQDEDTLDTWASSWLWPFATLGWPEGNATQKEELNYWYPTSALVTGPDIIFFWVARMIMAGLEFMENDTKHIKDMIPFKTVYFTGIIRDNQGRKMSKSLGNSPDPIELIEKYGADGLRFGILTIAPQGQDIHFQEDRIEQGRNFCNKLWNACRFRLMSGDLPKDNSLDSIIQRMDLSLFEADDHAILNQLLETMQEVEKDLQLYEFNSAVLAISQFFKGDFCDWYVEISKTKLKDTALKENCLAIQDFCIRQSLLLLHPFIPFITEELWEQFGFGSELIENFKAEDKDETLNTLIANGIKIDNSAVQEIASIRDFISKARALKAHYKLQSKQDVIFKLAGEDKGLIEKHQSKLLRQVGAKIIELTEHQEGMPGVVTPLGTLYLELSSSIDVETEKKRLEKELEKLEKAILSGESKLKDDRFLAQAPSHIVEGAKKQLNQTLKQKEEVERLLAAL